MKQETMTHPFLISAQDSEYGCVRAYARTTVRQNSWTSSHMEHIRCVIAAHPNTGLGLKVQASLRPPDLTQETEPLPQARPD